MNAAIALALVQLSLDSRLGTSTAPYVTDAFPEVSGYGAVVDVGVKVPLSPRWSIGGRAALALMRIEQPAGALFAEAAWANPELHVGFEQPLGAAAGWTLSVAPRVALGLPLAEHASRDSQLEGRALALANAFEGFGEPELFTPGVVPVTPSARLELRDRRWRLDWALKVPLLLRVSAASLPPESDKRTVGVVPVLELGARFQPWHVVTFGVAPRLTWRALAPVEEHRGALQPLIAALAELHPARALDVALFIQAPLAGPLGGSTLAGGLRLEARF